MLWSIVPYSKDVVFCMPNSCISYILHQPYILNIPLWQVKIRIIKLAFKTWPNTPPLISTPPLFVNQDTLNLHNNGKSMYLRRLKWGKQPTTLFPSVFSVKSHFNAVYSLPLYIRWCNKGWIQKHQIISPGSGFFTF